MHQITLLDESGCRRWVKAVDRLRSHWIQRRPPHGFYTLGAASYLDVSARSREPYEAAHRATTPLLKRDFSPLLDEVAGALAQIEGMPAVYDDSRFALPGFHIYEAHPEFAEPVARIHCDRQYEALDWSPYGVNPANGRTLSFTLSLELPTGGGGLNVWPVSHRESTIDRETSRRSFTEEHRRYHPYSAGSLVLHAGDLVHQAVIQRDPAATGRRITLQGHGVDVGGRWVLYW